VRYETALRRQALRRRAKIVPLDPLRYATESSDNSPEPAQCAIFRAGNNVG
jgi:hypothetical protein